MVLPGGSGSNPRGISNYLFVVVKFIPGGDLMETKVEYLIKPIVERKVHRCPQCFKEYGFESNDGRLIVGELILTHFIGICAKCGNPLSWYATDRLMRSLAERIRAR